MSTIEGESPSHDASRLVDAFVSGRAARGALEARELETLAAVAGVIERETARMPLPARGAEIPRRAMIAELAVAARASERTIGRQLDDAADLCARFAATVEELRAGRISRQHVQVIHEVGASILDDEARARYEMIALARAEEDTPGRLRPILEVIASRMHPTPADERHAEARRDRRVSVIDLSGGMAELWMYGPAPLVHGIFDRLTQQARAVIDARTAAGDGVAADGAAGARLDTTEPDRMAPDTVSVTVEASAPDTRSIDEVRADILCDLLLTGTPQTRISGDAFDGIRARVQITVPVLTIAGVGDEPALLGGYGPIDSETARRLAGAASGWDRVMTSPVSGEVLAVDRYRPSEQQKRLLAARDEHCRFPGCRMPVWRCDLDHTTDAAHGGPTECANLAHLCRGHHILKHESRWAVRQLAGGLLEWTSPTGRVYVDRPEPTLRFIPDDPPADPSWWRAARPDDERWSYRPDGDPPAF